jgi:Protein of unknown function (DUF2891)
MTRRLSLACCVVACATVIHIQADGRGSSHETNAQQGRGMDAGGVSAPIKDLEGLYRSLPNASMPVLDESNALFLAAMPLACLDRPHATPATRGYLWEATYRPVDDFQKNLAFYGCFDWHSSVNSIWTLVRLLKSYPSLPIAGMIRHKLNRHLDKSNAAGELAYLKGAGQFERPYGYAWILKLSAEMSASKDEDLQKWAANMAPLTEWTAKEMTQFLKNLEQPNRGGAHPNTAFAMHLMLDYVDITKDETLRAAISETATRFYSQDKNCETKTEPAGSDFLSPCLTEAAVMSRVLDRQAFQTWFDTFLPPMFSADFKPLTEPVDTSGITKPERLAGKSHLIGLAFQRGAVMNRIADALPTNDKRAGVLRRLAAIHGVKGMQGMHDAGYFGSHWLGTYAVYYMLSPQTSTP